MDQKPDFNNAYITVRLSPGCSEETLNAVIELLRRNGVSHVRPDVNMRVCIRSAINPFAIVDEIKKVDAGADLFMYSKEEPPANSHRKSSPKTHEQTNGYKEEKCGMEDDQNGRSYHKPPGYGHKKQMPNVMEDGDFEDVKDPRNVRRYPNDSKEHKRNTKRDDQHYSSRDHKAKCYYNYRPEEYVCQNDREYSNQQAPPKVPLGAFSRDNLRSQSCRFDGTSSQQTPPQPHYPGYSSRNHKGQGYYHHYPEEYVCRNERENRNQQAPPKEPHIPSGAYSRDNLRSQSCRFDGRNSQQPPPQPHYPGYTQKTRYDSPIDSHYARNSHYQKNEYDAPQAEPHNARNSHYQKNEFDAPQAEPHYARNSHYQKNEFDAPQAEPHYARNSHYQENEFNEPSCDAPQAHPHYPPRQPDSYEEHHNHHSNMAQPPYNYDHLHQNHRPYGYEPRCNWDMPFYSDYHMGGNPHGCNIL